MGALGPVIASLDPDLVATPPRWRRYFIKRRPSSSPVLRPYSVQVGMFGLLLASMGIFGTVSYMVVLRTREVGIRIALGAEEARHPRTHAARKHAARARRIARRHVSLCRGVLPAARHPLWINIVDGVSFAGVSFLFLAIALFAAYLPSRRAMRVDPIMALRYE